jgi:SAM-dependent methyltransferase
VQNVESNPVPGAGGSAHAAAAPSPWIARFAPLALPGARVLDLACGHGRHARHFAARGHRVVAVDRDVAAIAALADDPRIDARALDLEAGGWPLAGERFDVIVVANYLHRPLFPHLRAALADDGLLLYETFALGNEAYGRPANPDFLLARGELLDLASRGLTVVAFEQGYVPATPRGAVISRLAAVGAHRPWPPLLPPP